MRLFQCDSCGNLTFFENVLCVRCQRSLGFLPDVLDLSALDKKDDGQWTALSPFADGRDYRSCQNGAGHGVCNWLVPSSDSTPFCQSCRLNDVIPDLTIAGNQERWHKLEAAKRRMLHTLLQLRLPLDTAPGGPALRFRFLGDTPGGPPVLTGHANGVITVNIAEASDDERERRRVALGEPFRTLLGHFRHEVAHYYWDVLIRDSALLERFRELFGDERADYSAALKTHYENGPSSDWQARCVSAYASAHPWEDWAETFAHYLHITDTLETAASFGISLRPKHPQSRSMTADFAKETAASGSFDQALRQWHPLTYALNELNRGMGLLDHYPFVLSPAAEEKLRFAHEAVRKGAGVLA